MMMMNVPGTLIFRALNSAPPLEDLPITQYSPTSKLLESYAYVPVEYTLNNELNFTDTTMTEPTFPPHNNTQAHHSGFGKKLII